MAQLSSFLGFVQTGASLVPYLQSAENGSEKVPLNIHQVALNPMTAMAQLALLYHMEEGTKIDFEKYQIAFNRPSTFQGAVRGFNHSNRDSLLKLESVISTALSWYKPQENLKVRKIFLRTIRGLKVLKNTYIKKSEITADKIDQYIKNIAEACFRGAPKKEITNEFQNEVYGLGWKEVENISQLFEELPGEFNAQFFEQMEVKALTEEEAKLSHSDKPQEQGAKALNRRTTEKHASASSRAEAEAVDKPAKLETAADNVVKPEAEKQTKSRSSVVCEEIVVPHVSDNLTKIHAYFSSEAETFAKIVEKEVVKFVSFN